MQTPHVPTPPISNILDRIADGIVAFDTKMNYTYVNHRGGELLHRMPEDLIGKNYWKEYPEAKGTPFANAYGRAMETQETIVIEDYYAPFDRWFENRIYPSNEGLTIFFTEITDRKKAEAEIRRERDLTQKIMETSPTAIVIANRNGKITYANRRAEEVLGSSKDDITQRDYKAPSWQTTDFDGKPFPDEQLPFSQVARTKQPVYGVQHAIEWPDGKRILLSINGAPLFASSSEFDGMVATLDDITERTYMEMLLALESQIFEKISSRESLQDILSAIVLGIEALSKETIASILLLDPDGIHVRYGAAPHLPAEYNNALEGAPIGPKEGSCGTAMFLRRQVVVPDIETDPLWDGYRELARMHGLRACWSTPVVGRNGTVLASFAMYYREPRSPSAEDFALIERVTHLAQVAIERNREEELLQSSELRYRRLFETAKDGILILDADTGAITDINPYLIEMLGYPAEELVGKKLWEISPFKDIAANQDAFNELKRQEYVRYEDLPLQSSGGQSIEVEFVSNVYAVGGTRVIQCNIRDITERKQAEEALLASHKRLQKVLEVETVGVMFWDLTTGCMTDANDTFLNLMGYSRREVEARELTWQKLTPPEYMEVSLAEIRKFQATGRVGPYEKEYLRKDGTRQWLVFAGSSLGGNACVEFCVDISERKRVEAALRKSEERFRAIASHTPDHIILQDRDLRYRLVINPQLGLTGADMIGKTDLEILPGEDGEKLAAIKKNVLETAVPHNLQVSLKNPKGSFEHFEGSYIPELDEDGRPHGLIGYFRNITERKQAEEELKRSHEQLRTLTNHLQTVIEEERARVARDIHDDIGQLLTVTKMNLSLLGRTIDAMKEKKIQNVLEREIEALVKLLDEGVQSIRKIVRDLRPEVLETLGLLAGVEWQAKEFEKRTRVHVSLSLPKELSNISSTHTTALFRAVQEGLTNIARHAEATKVTIELTSSAEGTRVVVEDNGKGVSEEAMRRPGSFGLLAMRERIRALDGNLEILSEIGHGTKVIVTIPTA